MASYSGFWARNNGNTYGMLVNRNPAAKRIKRQAKTEGFRDVVALINSLVGATSGSNATATYKRVKSLTGGLNQGGKRTYETVTDLNRNTTAADVTALKALFANAVAPSTYPANKSKKNVLA